MTVGSVARHFGCRESQIRKLFDRGFLPAPPRAGNSMYRIIDANDLPEIEKALKACGYLKDQEQEAASACS